MTHSEKYPRTALALIGFAVWFGPSFFLIPQLLKDNVSWKEIAYLLPIFHGYTTEWMLARTHERFSWGYAVAIAVVLPVVLIFALFCTSHRRAVVIGGAVVSLALTAAGYCLLIA